MTKRQFMIDGYVLVLDEPNLLVLVDECDDDRSAHTVADLPAWVFKPESAIWLTWREKPVGMRALEGETIRTHLLSSLASDRARKTG